MDGLLVEITLKRSDGSVVTQLLGSACVGLTWGAVTPVVITPDGPRLLGFTYTPAMVDKGQTPWE